MPAEQHKKAQKHYEEAAKNHGKAAESATSGDHTKAAHYGQTAQGHASKGNMESKDASMKYAEKHGNK